jgi:hypothetical protein
MSPTAPQANPDEPSLRAPDGSFPLMETDRTVASHLRRVAGRVRMIDEYHRKGGA